jgi:hypothetical protein
MKKWLILALILVVAGGVGILISAMTIDRMIIPEHFTSWYPIEQAIDPNLLVVIQHDLNDVFAGKPGRFSDTWKDLKAKGLSLNKLLQFATEYWERVMSQDKEVKTFSWDRKQSLYEDVQKMLDERIAEEYPDEWNEYNLIVSNLKKQKAILTGVLYTSISSAASGTVIFIACFIWWLIKSKKMSKFVDIVCFCLAPTVLIYLLVWVFVFGPYGKEEIFQLLAPICIFLLLLGIVRVCWRRGNQKSKR